MDLELVTLWLAGGTVVLAVDTVAAARILVPRAPGDDITAIFEARDFRLSSRAEYAPGRSDAK